MDICLGWIVVGGCFMIHKIDEPLVEHTESDLMTGDSAGPKLPQNPRNHPGRFWLSDHLETELLAIPARDLEFLSTPDMGKESTCVSKNPTKVTSRVLVNLFGQNASRKLESFVKSLKHMIWQMSTLGNRKDSSFPGPRTKPSPSVGKKKRRTD